MDERVKWLLITVLLAAIAAFALIQTRNGDALQRVFRVEPELVMGTSCSLVVVADREQHAAAEGALQLAESELRRLEALLSTWIDSSPISRFNAAAADTELDLSPEVLEVLLVARRLHAETGETFDITTRPLIELWRRAGEENRLPTEAALAQARAESDWSRLKLLDGAAIKSADTARVDVDGIAKGYAIDRALLLLQQAGLDGGLVEVGGDLRVFGTGPEDGVWRVAIRSPFDERPWGELEIQKGAVCSSGDYARHIEIGGRRYSHILDPRSGWSATESRSVTVIAPDAATADVWATALSVLGVDGLSRFPPDSALEALIFSGYTDDYKVWATPGFKKRLVWSEFESMLEISPTTRPDRPST
jgi:thiamine biosynthesis lipoprotein